MHSKPKGKKKTGKSTHKKKGTTTQVKKGTKGLVSGDNVLIAEIAGVTRQYVTAVKAGKKYNARIARLLKLLPEEKEFMKSRLAKAVEILIII